ncbi:hypothetical protein TPA0598_07_06600 [Streptomyces lydicamycinicus]|uniref:Uncharacterized protein n=1 Tax=Streptomyces lydicamycinicus TaxID=1546107 RepID=A0A0P4RBK8_9ACTN|nr:hypothetical protein TPA0598_07_06600 [Streptomyces lydicamycinicus]
MALERAHRPAGRRVPPEFLDEYLGGDDPAQPDEQQGEHGPAAGRTERQLPSVVLRRHGPQDAKERSGGSRSLVRAGQGSCGHQEPQSFSHVPATGCGPKGTTTSRKRDLGTVGGRSPDVEISHRQGSGKEHPALGKSRSAAGAGCRKGHTAGWVRGTSYR